MLSATILTTHINYDSNCETKHAHVIKTAVVCKLDCYDNTIYKSIQIWREIVWSRNGFDLKASGTRFRRSASFESLPSDVSSLMFLV